MRTETGAIVLAAVGEYQEGDFRVHIIAGAAGFVSLFFLWLATVWGVVLRAGWGFSRVKQTKLYAFHRSVATMGLALGIVHALCQLAAPSGTIAWYDLFVPFINEIDPLGTGLGIVGLEVLVAVVVSTMIQKFVGSNRWRALHATAYLAFTMVSAHVLISGAEVILWDSYAWVSAVVVVGWLITVVLGMFTVIRPKWLFPREAQQTAIAAEVGPDAEVQVHVDPLRCTRFGFCQHEAPSLFRMGNDGSLSHQSSVGPDQMAGAVRAARGCPARAITLGAAPPSGKVMTGSFPAIAPSAADQERILRPVPTSPAVGPAGQPLRQPEPAMMADPSGTSYRQVYPQQPGYGAQIYEPVSNPPRRESPPAMPLREYAPMPAPQPAQTGYGHLRAVPSPPVDPGHRAGDTGRHHRRDH